MHIYADAVHVALFQQYRFMSFSSALCFASCHLSQGPARCKATCRRESATGEASIAPIRVWTS